MEVIAFSSAAIKRAPCILYLNQLLKTPLVKKKHISTLRRRAYPITNSAETRRLLENSAIGISTSILAQLDFHITFRDIRHHPPHYDYRRKFPPKRLHAPRATIRVPSTR